MNDLIDRQAAIEAVQEELNKQERSRLVNIWTTAEVRFFVVEAILKQIPTAKPKTGRWKPYPIADGCIQCSVCGILRVGEPSNYCPNCGAKMEGVDDGSN